MTPTLLVLTLVVGFQGDGAPSTGKPAHKPSPLAPSLPELTEAEEKRLDDVIDRFIKQDTGQLTGEEGDKARREFDKLGPDATFALLRGLNRAARIEHSCPALVIARKLARIFNNSNDKDLLDFARENIGAGITQSRHLATLKDLRMLCTLRRNAVERQGPNGAGDPVSPASPSSTTPLGKMSIAELADALGSERGTRQKQVAWELSYRPEEEALTVLDQAASGAYDQATRKVGRDFLERALGRRSADVAKEKLRSVHSEMRAAAARVTLSKKYRFGAELIELLDDDFDDARDTAHKALVQLARGQDFGPDAKASPSERAAAIEKWRAWWAAQK